MPQAAQIPVLKPNALDDFHFGNIDWHLPFTESHNLFHINRLEGYKDKIAFPLPPHRKTVYDFVFLTKGQSVRSKGLNQYTFCESEFFFLPAYQITSHQFMSADAEGYFVHFDVEIFQHISLQNTLDRFSFLDFLANPVVQIPSAAQLPFLHILIRLEQLYFETDKDFSLIVFYLLALFAEVEKFVVAEKNLKKNSAALLIQQFKNALTQHIYHKQSIVQYADFLNVTPNHLNKCVKSVTNKTAQDLLNEMLIMEAKSLLKYSNLQIAEIAVKLCDQTPSNFARFFKSQTGISPKEYILLK
jgi:AraC family transcriptional regulator, transcriptional activator of pobA